MKFFKTLIIVIALAVIFSGSSYADEKKIVLSLSSGKAAPGRQVQLLMAVPENREFSPPILPYIDGLNVRYKATSNDGGKLAHVYTVAALKAGRYKIGPFTFKEKGDTYVSNAVFLDVAAGAASEPARPAVNAAATAEADLAKKVFLDVSIPKKEVYINELVPVYVKFHTDWLDIIDLDILDIPNKRYITDKYVSDGNSASEKDGVKYIVIAYKKSFYVPEAGDFTFGPVKARFTVTKKKADLLNDNEEFYNKFVGKKDSRVVEMTTETYNVKVIPLPGKGKPDGFKGAIGDLALEIDAAPGTVKTGGTIDLTMRITGTGNLRTVNVPDILPRDGVILSEPRINREEGVIVIRQTIKVYSPSLKALPSVNFSYFDPDKKEYFVIKKELSGVTLVPSSAGESEREAGREARDKEKTVEGLIASKDDPGKICGPSTHIYESGVFLFIQILPLLLLIITAVSERRRKMIEADTAYVLRLKASKSARTGVNKARAHMRAGKPKEFYTEVFKLMQVYLGTRLSKPPESVTDEVAELLKGIEQEEVRGKIKNIFSDCYVARYAPAKPDKDDMEATLNEVKETLGGLDKVKDL